MFNIKFSNKIYSMLLIRTDLINNINNNKENVIKRIINNHFVRHILFCNIEHYYFHMSLIIIFTNKKKTLQKN